MYTYTYKSLEKRQSQIEFYALYVLDKKDFVASALKYIMNIQMCAKKKKNTNMTNKIVMRKIIYACAHVCMHG